MFLIHYGFYSGTDIGVLEQFSLHATLIGLDPVGAFPKLFKDISVV